MVCTFRVFCVVCGQLLLDITRLVDLHKRSIALRQAHHERFFIDAGNGKALSKPGTNELCTNLPEPQRSRRNKERMD